MYLLDTNTIIYFLKGQGRVAEEILKRAPQDISVSALTIYEIEVGLNKSPEARKKKPQIEEFFRICQTIAFGEKEAHSAAKIRAELERQGTPIGPIDNLIAGTALLHHATLVTRNTSEFKRVGGLTVEDWY